jgi:hypothetical protein
MDERIMQAMQFLKDFVSPVRRHQTVVVRRVPITIRLQEIFTARLGASAGNYYPCVIP